jgi:hypothetical protein
MYLIAWCAVMLVLSCADIVVGVLVVHEEIAPDATSMHVSSPITQTPRNFWTKIEHTDKIPDCAISKKLIWNLPCSGHIRKVNKKSNVRTCCSHVVCSSKDVIDIARPDADVLLLECGL